MPKIVGVSNAIGTLVSSLLTEAQFQLINGTTWVVCNGQSIAGSLYATTTGVTTAPDLRGRTIAGKDNMGGVTASRLTAAGSGITGTTLGTTGGAETHVLNEKTFLRS